MIRAAHLKYAGLGFARQRDLLRDMLRGSELHMATLTKLRESGLSQGLVVSGFIYNFVWNRLTGRDDLTGIKDIDLFYFDDADLSYDAEDREIRRVGDLFGQWPIPVQLRNQARVHLWYAEKFGRAFSPLKSCRDMLPRFAAETHAVAAFLDEKGEIQIIAPFGLDPIFTMRIIPNMKYVNPKAYVEKAARAVRVWPELSVEPLL